MNLDIIGLVRNMGLDPDQLAALIHTARAVQPSAPDPAPVGQEESAYEEN